MKIFSQRQAAQKQNSGYRRVPRQSIPIQPEAASMSRTDISPEDVRRGGQIFDDMYERMTAAEASLNRALDEINSKDARIYSLQRENDDLRSREHREREENTLLMIEKEASYEGVCQAIDNLETIRDRMRNAVINDAAEKSRSAQLVAAIGREFKHELASPPTVPEVRVPEAFHPAMNDEPQGGIPEFLKRDADQRT